MYEGKVLAGFAGASSDAFTLFEMFEKKLEQYMGSLARAAYELSKEWRQDKFLRRLEAMLLVADTANIYLINGAGDIVEPDYDAIAIGSGSVMAYSSALALLENSDLGAEDIARKSLEIASRICVFTNSQITIETLEKK
jgi:ATP-dependent HslUV protease subunit HslV